MGAALTIFGGLENLFLLRFITWIPISRQSAPRKAPSKLRDQRTDRLIGGLAFGDVSEFGSRDPNGVTHYWLAGWGKRAVAESNFDQIAVKLLTLLA